MCKSFQAPYNKVTYSIVGDDAAPNYFEVDGERGDVKVKTDIKSDLATDYQIRVVASDGGTPPKNTMTLVLVHVNRNMFAPKFDQDRYEKEVLETQALGVPFTKVQARDEDQKVAISFSISSLLCCLQL